MDRTPPIIAASRPTNVLVVGVGGQGVIMLSKVIALVCQQSRFEVKQSEVHGMAKRGGAVFSHVRFGQKVWSPTIPRGEADVLVALEWAEGLRWLPHLNSETGIFICDTKRIVPPFSCRNRQHGAPRSYSRETPSEVLAHVAEGYAIDATDLAQEMGNERAANTVLLGALSCALGFPSELWESAISESVPEKTLEVNLRAFREGRTWIERCRSGEQAPMAETVHEPTAPAMADYEVDVQIERAWCKNCDICVKLCPERCLALDAEQIAVLARKEACTGCRLCEWLCPDFAIRVHTTPKSSAAPEQVAKGVPT